MKVSILALLATAMLATASIVPSCDSSTSDIAEHDLTVVTTKAVCLRVCWPKKHKCPKGWTPKKIGRCWTCCSRPHPTHGFELEEEEFEGVDEFDELD
jgi:hypothetical protein